MTDTNINKEHEEEALEINRSMKGLTENDTLGVLGFIKGLSYASAIKAASERPEDEQDAS